MNETKMLRVKNPSDLLAAVPGFLGFHPRDSAVLLTVGQAATPFHARVDLPVAPDGIDELVANMVQVSRRAGTDRVAVVLYSDDAVLSDVVLEALEVGLAAVEVAVALAVRADGERWFCLAGCRDDCCPDGTPYDVSTHPITVAAVVEGRVVHESREALRDSLVGGDPDEVDRVWAAMDRPAPDDDRAHLVQEGRWVQDRVRRFAGDRVRLDATDVGRLLVALASIEVRDVAWSEITREEAGVHVDLWRDVVRRSPMEALAPPAALLAFAAWLAGDGALAWCAVDRCQESDPGYSLGTLIAQTLACAMPPSSWQPLTPDMLTLFAG